VRHCVRYDQEAAAARRGLGGLQRDPLLDRRVIAALQMQVRIVLLQRHTSPPEPSLDNSKTLLTETDFPTSAKNGMDEPVDYGELGAYLASRTDCRPSAFGPRIARKHEAKFLLDWKPAYDLKRLTDAAWDYQRPAGEPRAVWYPG
jgi:hypothetical protein